MSFALPNAMWLAACAVPIVVFYILKVRLRRQPVSTNLFWKQIYDEKPPRSIWQYLRHLLSLLVQLCVLALLVLAIADPYLPWQLLQSRRIVAVIDRSASMQTADVLPTRFDAAIDAAVTLVDGLRFRDEMAIVAAGPRPEVVIGMSGHVPTLKRALREITVSDNPTDLSTAIELGKQLLGDHPRGQVLVYTDGCVESPLEPAQEAPAQGASPAVTETASSTDANSGEKAAVVKHHIFASQAANLGITQFQVRRSLVDPLGYEVLVAVQNANEMDMHCRLELELDGVPVDVLPLRLKPEEKWRRSLQKTSLEGGHLVARLTQIATPDSTNQNPDDSKSAREPAPTASLNALEVDDTAWAILPAREQQRVLLVTEGNLFLQKVFEANPLVLCQVQGTLPDTWPADTIVVLHRQVPEQLPPGNVLVVDPTGSCSDWELGEGIENPIVTQQDADSPLMTHVRLDNVLMPEARRITFKETPHVLAGTLSGDVVYAATKRDTGKCLVLSVDLDKSDLAFRTAFPIMVTNALGWFQGNTGELQSSLPTGEITKYAPQADKLAGNANLLLRSPSGRELPISSTLLPIPVRVDTAPLPVQVRDRERSVESPSAQEPPTSPNADAPEISLGPFDECGIWMIVAGPSPEQQTVVAEFAVNLANERESDLRPREELANTAQAAALAASWFARPLWFYIAACACAITVTEWFLYQRRVIT
jgi:hypothetical protein